MLRNRHRESATASTPRRVPRPVANVRFLVIMLAVVPLAGAAWFATRELSRTLHDSEQSSQVTAMAQEHAELSKLRSYLLDERNWVVMAQGTVELGIPSALVSSLTGIQIDEELATARAGVDKQLAFARFGELATQLRTIRTQAASSTEARDRYLDFERQVAGESDAVLRALLTQAGNVDGGGDLVLSLRALEAATDVRQAVASELTTYFAVQFPTSDNGMSDASLLAGQHALYEDSMDRLRSTVHADSATASSLAAVESSPDVIEFRRAIDRLVALNVGFAQGEFTFDAVFANLDQIVSEFKAGTSSTRAHVSLVDSAARDVIRTSDLISDQTGSEARSAGLILGLLFMGSLTVAVAIGHFISSPLRQLADRAQHLRLAGEMRPGPRRGPREVRQVARAIDEAAAHLVLAERQAHALAEGDLAHPALSEGAPGHLGSSLQHAVQTLAKSMDEREEYRRRLAHEASHDGLTALPNRNSSLAHLSHALARTRRNSASLAVMFVDLDGFKEINDNHGHLVGDTVLREVASRLMLSVREGDHVGRLGGDEFIIVAEPVRDVEEAMAIAARVRDAVSAPIEIEELRIEPGSSIGVAIANHDSDLTPDEFLRDADLAVYKAKSLGTGCVELCDFALKREVLDGVELERALRQAILSDEFVLYYQPIVGRDQNEILGAEALVRWNRPGYGTVTPANFIPFAERSDLIIDIDAWVIKKAAHRLAAWTADEEMCDVPVAVNVSARHFASDRFVANVLDPLRKYRVEPSRLIVEVTESALLSDLAVAAEKLQALRDAGITIALDDFGTGYTSLAYLRALPVDIIKIDRSFIADVKDELFVKLIIETGHLIGATITGEGIETEAQAQRLLLLGCDRFQGYHYGEPRPIYGAPRLQSHPRHTESLEDEIAGLATAR